MKRILFIAVLVLGLSPIFAQKQTETLYGKSEDKPLEFKVNVEKLKEKGFRNTKKGTLYIDSNGNITLRKLRFRTAMLMEQIPTCYYEMQTYTGKIKPQNIN